MTRKEPEQVPRFHIEFDVEGGHRYRFALIEHSKVSCSGFWKLSNVSRDATIKTFLAIPELFQHVFGRCAGHCAEMDGQVSMRRCVERAWEEMVSETITGS